MINIRPLYRQLIKALVKTERRAAIKQGNAEKKKQLSLLTYQRMQIVRKQQIDKTNIELVKRLGELNKQVSDLKDLSYENDKSLYFLKDSKPFRQYLLANINPVSKEFENEKRLREHVTDTINFINNQREYEELMDLYNLSQKYTQKEKIDLTAHRVGLNVPI